MSSGYFPDLTAKIKALEKGGQIGKKNNPVQQKHTPL